MTKKIKAKFEVGQVVAIFYTKSEGKKDYTEYHCISGRFYDSDNVLRYSFSDSLSLAPIEDILRALTPREAGAAR